MVSEGHKILAEPVVIANEKKTCCDKGRPSTKMSCSVSTDVGAQASSARLEPPSVGRHFHSNGGCLSMIQGPSVRPHLALSKTTKTRIHDPHQAHNTIVRPSPQKGSISCMSAPSRLLHCLNVSSRHSLGRTRSHGVLPSTVDSCRSYPAATNLYTHRHNGSIIIPRLRQHRVQGHAKDSQGIEAD